MDTNIYNEIDLYAMDTIRTISKNKLCTTFDIFRELSNKFGRETTEMYLLNASRSLVLRCNIENLGNGVDGCAHDIKYIRDIISIGMATSGGIDTTRSEKQKDVFCKYEKITNKDAIEYHFYNIDNVDGLSGNEMNITDLNVVYSLNNQSRICAGLIFKINGKDKSILKINIGDSILYTATRITKCPIMITLSVIKPLL